MAADPASAPLPASLPVEEHNEEEIGAPEIQEEQPALHADWDELVDPSSGLPYYINKVTNETTWDRPLMDTSAQGVADENDPVVHEVVEHATEMEGTAIDAPELLDAKLEEPASELPHGWVEIFDSTTGNPYYLNELTQETSWERPLMNNGEPTAAQDLGAAIDELPAGWEEQVDQEGQIFYFNQEFNLTQWERPVAEVSQKPEPLAQQTGSAASTGVTTKDRSRPAHAIATFGFGGRLCVWRQGGAEARPVEIHRACNVLPNHDIVENEKVKQAEGISGPLNSADESCVKSYAERKTELVPEDLLWQLIQIVSQSKGRIRSQGGFLSPGSPESHIVELMLKDGSAPSTEPKNGTNGNNIPGLDPSMSMEYTGKTGQYSCSLKCGSPTRVFANFVSSLFQGTKLKRKWKAFKITFCGVRGWKRSR